MTSFAAILASKDLIRNAIYFSRSDDRCVARRNRLRRSRHFFKKTRV